MTIAVDFDGTIVEHRYPEIGNELPFATETLKMLIAERHKLILWTARDGKLLDEAVEWCRKRGLEFYGINSNRPVGYMFQDNKTTSAKVIADIYIDDHNLGGLPEWGVIYEMISHKKKTRKRKSSFWKKLFGRKIKV